MIRSSVFSFDESSIWDPKAIRQQLNIPEDQFNILNNIPDWSKSKDDESTSRIEIDTCERSTSTTLHISYKNLPKSQPSKKNNTELFDEHSKTRKSIIDSYKLRAQKLSKSQSLLEIDKINQDLPNTKNFRSTLSLPNLHFLEFSKNSSREIETEDCWPGRHCTFSNKKIISLISETSNLSRSSIESNKNLSKVKRSESKSTQYHNMEIISQLPVAVPNHNEKVQNSKSDFEVIEKNVFTNNQNLQPFCNSSNSDQAAILENSSKITESDSHDSHKKDEINSVEVSVPNNHKLEISEKSDTLNSLKVTSEKCNTDICVIKETAFSKNYRNAVENVMSLPNSKDVKLCTMNKQKMVVATETGLVDLKSGIEDKITDNIGSLKTNETSNKGFDSLGVLNELESPVKKLVSSNECKKISCSSDMDIEFVQKTTNQKVGDKSVHTENLSVKRKSESKSRPSKKHRSSRDRQGDLNKRSLKKAGEICYSVEQVKSMLDIMKQFL